MKKVIVEIILHLFEYHAINPEETTSEMKSFNISDLKNPIKRTEQQKVPVTVPHEGSPVEEAIVKGRVALQEGVAEYKFGGLPDNSGK